MRLSSVIEVLEEIAPLSLAEDWDRVGLAVGDPAARVARGMLCIDLTEPVLAEAIERRCNLVVCYHPPIFAPLTQLTTTDFKQRIVLECARRGIALFSPHTALDSAPGGVNDWLCDGLGEGDRRAIEPARGGAESQVKIVTFVPESSLDAVRDAMAGAGAGVIGDYVRCSFSTAGTGTFQGGAATSPTIGRAGRFERVPETRMEMVCPRARLGEAVRSLVTAHPYETPALDIHPLEPSPEAETPPVGQGRRLDLLRPIGVATLVRRIKDHLGVGHVQVAAPPGRLRIRSIGLCAGAGGSVVADDPADAYFTGEMRHHDVLASVQRGRAVVLVGHTQTERPYLKVLRRRLQRLAESVDWSVSRVDRPPLRLG
ncbi:MAG: Nif3-like dinuclear metal center hexameric protein [Phycisphaeraceae bacterium]|nr:Nif3-like dinuclear metal center hexameric protein [Phycisphaeraceae bacterium]